MPIMVKAKVYVNPRVYSDAEEGFLPPFQKCISETIDIPCRRTKSTMRETDLKRPSEAFSEIALGDGLYMLHLLKILKMEERYHTKTNQMNDNRVLINRGGVF